jgi:hypothetical protein
MYCNGFNEPTLPSVFQIAGSLGALSLNSEIMLESNSACVSSPVAWS